MTVAGVSRAAQASSPAESSPRSFELEQQLALRVSELAGPQVRVAPTQAHEAAHGAAERLAELRQGGRPLVIGGLPTYDPPTRDPSPSTR